MSLKNPKIAEAPSKLHGCMTIMPCEVCILFNEVMPKVPKDWYESQLKKYEVDL